MQSRYYRTGEQLGLQLDAALSWLRGLGVSVDKGRVAGYRDALEVLREVTPAVLRNQGDAVRDALITRHEVADLIRVHQAYATRSGPRFMARLRTASRGAPLVKEVRDASGPRNLWAELSWGAMLECSGFHTDLESDVDVLQVEDVPARIGFSWEVKRPWSDAGIDDRVKEGCKQVQRAVAKGVNTGGHTVDGGCVVVVMDQLLARPGTFYEGDGRDTIIDEMKAVLRNWLREHEVGLGVGRGRYPDVLGVMLWWRPLTRVDGPSERASWGEAHIRDFFLYKPADTDDWRHHMLKGWSSQIEAQAEKCP